jgi:hypothetical protein
LAQVVEHALAQGEGAGQAARGGLLVQAQGGGDQHLVHVIGLGAFEDRLQRALCHGGVDGLQGPEQVRHAPIHVLFGPPPGRGDGPDGA